MSETKLNLKYYVLFFFPQLLFVGQFESEQSRLLSIDAKMKNRGWNTVVCKALFSADRVLEPIENACYKNFARFDSRSLFIKYFFRI